LIYLYYQNIYYIIFLGTFDVSVVSNLEKERRGKNEEKNFYFKSPSIHCYHFITPYLIGNSNKNMTLFHI